MKDRTGDGRGMYREIQWVTVAHSNTQGMCTGADRIAWSVQWRMTGKTLGVTGKDGIFIRTEVFRASSVVRHIKLSKMIQ